MGNPALNYVVKRMYFSLGFYEYAIQSGKLLEIKIERLKTFAIVGPIMGLSDV